MSNGKAEKVIAWFKMATEVSWKFLVATFSDKKNQIRFALAAVAAVLAMRLLPGFVIAGFEIALLVILIHIAVLTSAPYALPYLKLPETVVTRTLYLTLANWLLILFFDWALWYFDAPSPWWALIFSGLLAVFNAIIENLLNAND